MLTPEGFDLDRLKQQFQPREYIWPTLSIGPGGVVTMPAAVALAASGDFMAASTRRTPKLMFFAGWIISLLPILAFGVLPVYFYFFQRSKMAEGTDHVQFPEKYVVLIAGLEVACGILYAIPKTAVLGAILLTGYLGGAVACHVRLEQPDFIGPVIAGILPWLGLYLRDARVRDLIPFR
jgi:hypothetical protein